MTLHTPQQPFETEMMKPRILTLLDFYLPGYKAGGPLRTLGNMVAQLSDDFEFCIVTRDHDMGDTEPYASIQSGQWTRQGKAWVFYVPNTQWGVLTIWRLLIKTPYDILYLNSFFSPYLTALPLLLRHLGQLRSVPVVLAPRGEFSPSALQLKAVKKKIYMATANRLGLYRHLIWQASSPQEEKDIRSQKVALPEGKRGEPDIRVAPDLVPVHQTHTDAVDIPPRQAGPFRMVFISRISPMKNLDFLLRVLGKMDCDAELSIFGPPDDAAYWVACQRLIKELPSHIVVTYGGNVPHDQVGSIFAQHDLFVFPTRGENFGHVIFEALSAGTPVLVSDKTPWHSDRTGTLQTLPLDESRWRSTLEEWGQRPESEYLTMRRAALNYAKSYLSNNEMLQQNRELFAQALQVP